MPAAGRVIEVEAARLPGWVDRFAQRHGVLTIETSSGGDQLVIIAPDGARADVAVPFPPLTVPAADPTLPAMNAGGPAPDLVACLSDHLQVPRCVGIVLVRRGGWAVGVLDGGRLAAAQVGGGYVQGRTKAGGWSQQRYARRRGHQTDQVWQRAADGAAQVLLPHREELTALVTGGDRAGAAAVLADPRLGWLGPLLESRFLSVPDPTRAVLADAAGRLTRVVITLNALA